MLPTGVNRNLWCRWLLATLLIMLAAIPSGSVLAGKDDQLTKALAALYPPNEVCIFVPPPVWSHLYRPPESESDALARDRRLALDVIKALRLDVNAIIVATDMAEGMSPAVARSGGRLLEDGVRGHLETFTRVWRLIRRNERALPENDDLRMLHGLCSRAAMLAVFYDRAERPRTVVFSLLTGNRMVSSPLPHW